MTKHSNPSLKAKFTTSTLAVFAVNGTGMLLLFISQVVLARILGVDEYGIYTYVLSWLGMLALVGKTGLDSALQRFIPEYAGKQQWDYCRGVLLRSYQIALLASLLLGMLVWLLSPLMLTTLQTSYSVYILLMIAILPLSVLFKVTQGALLAFKRPALSQMTDSVMQSLIIIAGALLVGIYASHAATAVTLLGINLFAFFAALAAGLYLLIARTLPAEINAATAAYMTRQWMTVAVPLFVMSSMYVLMNYTDIVMLGLLKNTTDSGIYAAVSRITALVSLPLVFVNSVLIPYISDLYHGDRHADLQYVVTIATRIAGLLALPVFIVLVLFGDIFLGLFGTEFRTGKTAMNILVAGQLVNVLSGSVGALMMMTGRHHFASMVVTLCAALNILLNYLLIPKMGIEGAATATAITVVIWNVTFVLSTRSGLGIKPTFFATLKK